MFDSNPWQLYSTIAGWEACAARLDEAMKEYLVDLDADVTTGSTILSASLRASGRIGRVLARKENAHFGADDPECHHYAMWLIRKHVKRRFGVDVLDLV